MTDYPTDREKPLISAVEGLMEKTMKEYDPSHDALHVKRVRRTALAIARTLNPLPDLLIVEIAALMHDLADKKYVKLPPQTTLYQHFLPFFESIRSSASADSAGSGEGGLVDIIADGRLETIVRIVENVSWTTEKRLRAQAGGLTPWYLSCKELHCVQDADRLDAIGAFGIMRCAAYSAIVNRPLYVPADENEGDPNASAIGHFHDKLLLIRERLKTDAGRDMGEKRHKLMLDFLRGIDDEYDCLV